MLRYGAAGRDRTCDLSLRRQTLFQLSYNGRGVSLGQPAIKHYSSVSVIESMRNNLVDRSAAARPPCFAGDRLKRHRTTGYPIGELVPNASGVRLSLPPQTIPLTGGAPPSLGQARASARARIGDRVALQGNMDPTMLNATPERIREEVATILESYGSGTGHVFNLGHGVTPGIDPECVAAMVDAVIELSPAYHS